MFKRLYMSFRIGEKIAISFGLVGFLFLVVIWQFHSTLQRSLAGYQQLQDVFAAKKNHTLLIENHMLEARRAEKAFLLDRDKKSANDVLASLNLALNEAQNLSRVDEQGAQSSVQIMDLVQAYQQRFNSVFEAWEAKGLDHNSGLQGAFRDTVHMLESKAENFKVDRQYLQLLQIRRDEKDLGLRREVGYRDQVLESVGAFEESVRASNLEPELKNRLLLEAESYRESVVNYADLALSNQEILGGKGPFRDAAHRIESMLKTHYVPDLEASILQLRRREKDYLLRGEQQYVDMALREIAQIQKQLDGSAIADTDKLELQRLLGDYQRDFLALVDQNMEIDRLHGEMRNAIEDVTTLLQQNVEQADRSMQESSERINSTSSADARSMLWIAALAVLLGIVSAVVITLSIARPLRRMAGLLEQLAFEDPIERIPTVVDGRDEVNAMAHSVNKMADHKANLLNWWKNSMREKEAGSQHGM